VKWYRNWTAGSHACKQYQRHRILIIQGKVNDILVVDAQRTERAQKDLWIITKIIGLLSVGKRKDKLQLDHCQERIGRQEKRTDQ